MQPKADKSIKNQNLDYLMWNLIGQLYLNATSKGIWPHLSDWNALETEAMHTIYLQNSHV